MSLLSWWRSWRRKRRVKHAASDTQSLLREFVYLDETSVCSLVAARVGSIAETLTATQSESLQNEVGATVGVSGFVNAGLDGKTTGIRSRGSEILRKTIIQSTFKELHDMEKGRLVIKSPSSSDKYQRTREGQDLQATLQNARNGTWVIDASTLQRGHLFEVEVELATEPIYHCSAVVSAISGMIQDNALLLGTPGNSAIAKMVEVNQILERLIGELVPIRGRVLGYRSLSVDGREWLLHDQVLEGLSPAISKAARSVYAVGVAEQSLFWKDIRRVLFSKSRYSMLCRLAQDGLRDSWTPVKHSDVLGAVVPQFGQALEDGGRNALAVMTKSSQPDNTQDRRQRGALMAYAEDVASHFGRVLDDALRAELGAVVERLDAIEGVASSRRAFGAVNEFLRQRFDIAVLPEQAANFRTAALLGADLWLDGQTLPRAGNVSHVPEAKTDERYLDSEIVAIYW